jgi:hypothetical protein
VEAFALLRLDRGVAVFLGMSGFQTLPYLPCEEMSPLRNGLADDVRSYSGLSWAGFGSLVIAMARLLRLSSGTLASLSSASLDDK